MSYLTQDDVGSIAGLSDVGHLNSKKDKNGQNVGVNFVNAARRQSQRHGVEDMNAKREQDADRMAAWTSQQAANDQQFNQTTVLDFARVAAALAAVRRTTQNDFEMASISKDLVYLKQVDEPEIKRELQHLDVA